MEKTKFTLKYDVKWSFFLIYNGYKREREVIGLWGKKNIMPDS